MKMTTYEKQLFMILGKKYPNISAENLLKKLIEIGVLDFTLCKVLAVREYVDELVRVGSKKVDAMWCASEQFGCTYEYIRKCMYYYTDVNLR